VSSLNAAIRFAVAAWAVQGAGTSSGYLAPRIMMEPGPAFASAGLIQTKWTGDHQDADPGDIPFIVAAFSTVFVHGIVADLYVLVTRHNFDPEGLASGPGHTPGSKPARGTF